MVESFTQWSPMGRLWRSTHTISQSSGFGDKPVLKRWGLSVTLTSPRHWRRERVNKKQEKWLQVKPKNSQSETQGPTSATPMIAGQGEADICGWGSIKEGIWWTTKLGWWPLSPTCLSLPHILPDVFFSSTIVRIEPKFRVSWIGSRSGVYYFS
jgi:hypothetical protein